MIVDLSWPELRHGAYVGIDVYVRARARRYALAHGRPHDAWQAEVVGAWGELAVAKATGAYWSDVGGPDRGAPDVGGRYHVRTTERPDGRLILHDEDADDGLFVLVVVERLPRFRIVGCCYGHEGKQREYWQEYTGRPCYFVPHAALHAWDPFDVLAAT